MNDTSTERSLLKNILDGTPQLKLGFKIRNCQDDKNNRKTKKLKVKPVHSELKDESNQIEF